MSLPSDDVRNRESDCPVPYYQMHLGYVRMACHDQKFNHLRGVRKSTATISLRDDIKSVRMLQCGKSATKTGMASATYTACALIAPVSWQ